jgi:hypothetical protein
VISDGKRVITAMKFVVVNHEPPSRDLACSACARPLRSRLRPARADPAAVLRIRLAVPTLVGGFEADTETGEVGYAKVALGFGCLPPMISRLTV